MSGAGGRRLRLPGRHPADQGAVEAYFSGRWLDPDLVALAGFAEDARRLARGPGPVPSTPLAQLFADGFSPQEVDPRLGPAGTVTARPGRKRPKRPPS